MQDGLDCLLEYRASYVQESNPYLFALGDTPDSHIRATDVIRKFSVDCGASEPGTLRSRELRKHLAIQSQVLNLANNEMDTLAAFMGHSKEVHKQFYQLPSDVLEITKITKILLAMQNGNIKSLGEKTLAEIEDVDSDLPGNKLEMLCICICYVYGHDSSNS